ncbi:MAG: DUF2141 domain-containing protein [Flavobacterium sp.]|jgi:uncharacterized protein (DUF2141 family)
MKTIYPLSFLLLSVFGFAQEVSLSVKIKNIASNDGKIYVGVYADEKSFLKKVYRGNLIEIDGSEAKCEFKLPAGTYAVSIFHDENDNQKFDTGWFGIPIEDYGTSNNAKGFMGPPKFEDAKIELKENKTITISL